MRFAALSVGAGVPAADFAGRIAEVHRRAVLLAVADGRQVTLVAHELGRLPRAITFDVPTGFSFRSLSGPRRRGRGAWCSAARRWRRVLDRSAPRAALAQRSLLPKRRSRGRGTRLGRLSMRMAAAKVCATLRASPSTVWRTRRDCFIQLPQSGQCPVSLVSVKTGRQRATTISSVISLPSGLAAMQARPLRPHSPHDLRCWRRVRRT